LRAAVLAYDDGERRRPTSAALAAPSMCATEQSSHAMSRPVASRRFQRSTTASASARAAWSACSVVIRSRHRDRTRVTGAISTTAALRWQLAEIRARTRRSGEQCGPDRGRPQLVGTKVRFLDRYKPPQVRWGVTGVIVDMEERPTPLGPKCWFRARFADYITPWIEAWQLERMS
jgi:hypothetical protein